MADTLHDGIRAAFEGRLVILPLEMIAPQREATEAMRLSSKYRRIAQSIDEVGIIEPLVVARPTGLEPRYLLLDGHIRFDILAAAGEADVRCLISSDDEAFTYNKRINRLATIQEHYMIVRALKRGVSEEKLARALNVDVKAIKRRRLMLEGVCPEVVDLLKDRNISVQTLEVLRRMKPMRQIEAVELMMALGNFSCAYAKALLAATRQSDLAQPDKAKKVGRMTPEQMARLEREMETLNQDFRALEASYGDDVLQLVISAGYVGRLLANSAIHQFLARRQPELLEELTGIVNAASLDQAGPLPAIGREGETLRPGWAVARAPPETAGAQPQAPTP
ncbi:plasmid partitioning protein RepB C-terminal domain-containing protein [Caulobacter sp. KR2-114]|uniref:plasmid partitioning protein RepB C-terminal domain-containing protein n=1 Tax=Caulobacter sp. KR2-114 TaxID=3400912 RepID=UPI003BFD1910